METRVISIDGPAASGKSTVARRLAERLNFRFASSGEFYRAVAWAVLDSGLDPAKDAEVAECAAGLDITASRSSRTAAVLVNGIELHEELFRDEVSASVSLVSALPMVRAKLLGVLRGIAAEGDVVMEGRDIGSVVFPSSPWKYFLDASQEVRARRRADQGSRDKIAERDRIDSSRATAPLLCPPGALRVDTTCLAVDEVVAAIEKDLRARGAIPG